MEDVKTYPNQTSGYKKYVWGENILAGKVADQGKYQCAWSPRNRNYAKETHKKNI